MRKYIPASILLIIGICILIFSIYEGYNHNIEVMQTVMSNRTGARLWEYIGCLASFPIALAVNMFTKGESLRVVVLVLISIFIFVFVNRVIIFFL